MKMRTILLAAICSAVFAPSCKKEKAITPPTPKDELLGAETTKIFHYSFNGGLKDGSGNNLNATDSGNIVYGTDRLGRSNQAAVFGTSNNTSYVVTPSLMSKQIDFPFAVSFWMKPNTNVGSQTIIKSDGGDIINKYSGFWAQLGLAGTGSFTFSFANSTVAGYSGRNTLYATNVITSNVWHHIVVNCKGKDDMELFINGVKNTSITYDGDASTIVFDSNVTPGLLGVYGGGVPQDFRGMLDDYRIYKKVMTQTEVSKLYNFTP